MVIVAGFHLFPFRTEKLSPPAPMVLHTRGRVGSRRFTTEASASKDVEAFLVSIPGYSPTGPWATEVFRVVTECHYGLTKGSESPFATEGEEGL